jgi:SAM-dependent methyltransferase
MTTLNDAEDVYSRLRAIWNRDASTYDTRLGHGLQTDQERSAWRRVLEQSFDQLSSGSPLRTVDVGTGTGTMAMVLARMGHDVTGVDLAPAMLRRARENADRLGLTVRLIEANAEQLPLADDSTDVIFSRHVFWTLPRPIDTLREWVRVVRPGGIVAVADGWWAEPSRDMRIRRAIGHAIRKVVPGGQDGHPGYETLHNELPVAGGVSPYSIRYYLDQAGLVRLKVRDLKSVRAAERRSIPPWLWIDRARFTWLATGFKPD